MPIRPMPQFKAVPDKMLDIPQPAIGGLNLKDLEYEQEVNQSPYMLNVMYRNGAFGKRYGQEFYLTADDTIYSTVYYDNYLFVHAGTKLYSYDSNGTKTQFSVTVPESSGLFVVFAQKLYYLISSGFYIFENNDFSLANTYVPDFIINCVPAGGDGGDVIDELNILGDKAKWIFNPDGVESVYHLESYDSNPAVIDWDVTPTITVEDVAETHFSVDKANKTITFEAGHIPQAGQMTVVMEFTLKSNLFTDTRAKILSCKFYDTFGGAQNSRLFLAGAGNSVYYWSQAFDITYFPENNWARLGNTEEDITGFGRQYNVLIVFKPREVYSVYSYTETSSTTVIDSEVGTENFRSQLVNPRVGCDAPYSIQLINNLLTWYNSDYGICTLVSTNIQDERNVRVISRNIERTNNFGVKGILDYSESPSTVQSADYNGRYFIAFPTSGVAYMWDYEISPYRYSTSSGETNPRELDWFIFDHFFVKQFIKVEKALIYVSSKSGFLDKMVKLNETFEDVNYDGRTDGQGNLLSKVAIHSYYMTPFMQFGAVEMLKNIKNLYVQCRGDTNTLINLYYYTDDSSMPEQEPESINVGGGSFWSGFEWDEFHWFQNTWGNVFRRKCNIKKVQMASMYFENNEVGKDMSITHIGLQYQLVKYVR